MAGRLRKFKVHGAYKSKADARKKERSKSCNKQCFILERMVKGVKRFIVLQGKRKRRRR